MAQELELACQHPADAVEVSYHRAVEPVSILQQIGHGLDVSVFRYVREVTEEKQTLPNKDIPELEMTLTHREIEVLRLIAEGATNTEVSEKLFISPHTVKSHVIHIFNKLGVNDRTQAAVWATRHKII